MQITRGLSIGALVVWFLFLIVIPPTMAEERSFYSPVIFIDKEKNQILISTSAKVFYIEVSETAKPHLDKLPQGVLVDFVVEMRGDNNLPLLKTWQVKGGESTCMIFDGKVCK
ncbi:MAG TPA: hypothetical protein VEI50_00975 [Nitrospiraceae bacterium]|nr:hypothetical protein [Nitrospiraceae bacterium]